jgi:hypothetical protein
MSWKKSSRIFSKTKFDNAFTISFEYFYVGRKLFGGPLPAKAHLDSDFAVCKIKNKIREIPVYTGAGAASQSPQ